MRLAEQCAGLFSASLRRSERRHSTIVSRLSRIVILFGNQALLEKFLPALPFEFGVLQIRGARFNVGFRGNPAGFGRLYSCVRRLKVGALCIDIRRGLYAFKAQQDIAFFNVIAFLHYNLSNFADAFSEHICVGQRLDFPRSGDNGSQVLSRHDGSLDRHDVLIDLTNGEPYRAGQDCCSSDADRQFLPHIHMTEPWPFPERLPSLTLLLRRETLFHFRATIALRDVQRQRPASKKFENLYGMRPTWRKSQAFTVTAPHTRSNFTVISRRNKAICCEVRTV